MGEASYVWVRGTWEISVASSQFCYVPKTTYLKIKSTRKSILLLVIKLIQSIQIMDNHDHHFPNMPDIKSVL